jgi:non-ribosomal peptide synthetase component E (peptide arylation enzyme)
MRSDKEAVIWRARQRPDGIAVTNGTASFSYKALWRAVEDLTAKLAVLCAGLGAMGLFLDNSAAWVALLVRLGRPIIIAPIDKRAGR